MSETAEETVETPEAPVRVAVGRRGQFFYKGRLRGRGLTLKSVGGCQVTKVHPNGTVDVLFPRGGVDGQAENQKGIPVSTQGIEGHFVPTAVSIAPPPPIPASAVAAAQNSGATPSGGDRIPELLERVLSLEGRLVAAEDTIQGLQTQIEKMAEGEDF